MYYAIESFEGEQCIVGRDENDMPMDVYRLTDYPKATETPQQMVDRFNASVVRTS